jgi:redox-sensing transcriptional repressor
MTAPRSPESGSLVTPDTVAVPANGRADARTVPEATVARLATYLRVLSGLADRSVSTVSSEALAAAAGVNSAKLRKDLSHLGSYGIRGVGYDVGTLIEEISRTLGLTANRAVVLIGVGNLGEALAGYAGFASRGFQIAGLLDADPRRIGRKIGGLAVRSVADLEVVVAENGVTSILNFAPVVLTVPSHVDVRKVDLAAELQILSFHESRKAAAALEVSRA